MKPERHYLYDGDQLVAVFDSSDAEQQYYVNGLNGPVAVYYHNEDNERYYFLKDHLGSTRVMVDDTGNVVEYTNYHPFGEVSESWTVYNEPLEFTGKELDNHNTFEYSYFGARYYDADLGRFSTCDPLMDEYPGLSPYAYCANNPVLCVDPDGRFIDVILDIAFILYDVGDISVSLIQGEPISPIQSGALGADIACLFIPGATGGGLAVRFGSKAGDVYNAIKVTNNAADAGKVGRGASDAASAGNRAGNAAEASIKIEQHHMLPIEFEGYFKAAGLDIDDYIVHLPEHLHRLKSGEGIHTATGGNWNKRWEEWIKANPEPDPDKILEQLENMTKEFSGN